MSDKNRFEEIMSEIAELADEALHMVPPEGRERAKCYWYAHIKGAIGGEYGSEFLGGSMRSMTDELEAYLEPDEEDFVICLLCRDEDDEDDEVQHDAQ